MSWNKIARDSQKKIHRFPQTNLPNDFLNRPWNSARSRIRQGHRRTAGLSEENYKKMRTCAHGDSGRRRRALFSQRSVMPQWAKLLQDAGTVAEINALPFQRMFTGLHSIHSGCFVASPFSLSLSLSLSLRVAASSRGEKQEGERKHDDTVGEVRLLGFSLHP